MSLLLDRLARHASERPDGVAYCASSAKPMSWGKLAGGVSAVADLLRKKLPAGAVVILNCGNLLEYPIAFLGILAGNCTVFPISPGAADVELLRAARDSSAVGMIG